MPFYDFIIFVQVRAGGRHERRTNLGHLIKWPLVTVARSFLVEVAVSLAKRSKRDAGGACSPDDAVMSSHLLHTTYYYGVWWRGEDSNLRRHRRQIYSLFPLTPREPLQGYNSTYHWSQRRDSNPRPTDYKSAALPTELRWPAGPERREKIKIVKTPGVSLSPTRSSHHTYLPQNLIYLISYA